MPLLPNILSKIDHSDPLDFGGILNASVNLFKKVWLQAFVTMILAGFLVLPIYFVLYIPLVALGLMSPESFEGENGPGILFIVYMVLFVMAVFAVVSISYLGMHAAFYRICKHKDMKEKKSDDYFFFFKKKYFKKTITLGLMIFGICALAFICFILPLFYVMIPVAYMTVIYALNPDLSPNDIVKAGFALGNKKWGFTFLVVFVSWISSTIIGFALCLIGIYFTQQFIYMPFYAIYMEAVGLNEENEIDAIGAKMDM